VSQSCIIDLSPVISIVPSSDLTLYSCRIFFFFQAEDGIRDRNVTGVQTCALPISEYKGKDRILTMTACNPMFSARERYVAYAELTDWTPAQDGPPESIEDSKAYDKVTENGGA